MNIHKEETTIRWPPFLNLGINNELLQGWWYECPWSQGKTVFSLSRERVLQRLLQQSSMVDKGNDGIMVIMTTSRYLGKLPLHCKYSSDWFGWWFTRKQLWYGWWQRRHTRHLGNLSRSAPYDASDAERDSDGAGFTNLQESEFHSDPNVFLMQTGTITEYRTA